MMRALLVLGVMAPAGAWACAGLACRFVPALDDGGTMPANVPAVIVTSGTTPFFDFDVADAGFELRRANGELVPSTLIAEEHGRRVSIRPTIGLEAGESFTVKYPAGCGRGPSAVATFSTTSAQPLPTSIGTLSVKAVGHGQISIPEGNSCIEQMEGAYAQLAFTPSAELLPFLAVTHWALLVDGKPWADEEPGTMRASGLLGPIRSQGQFHLAPRVLEVYTPCPGSGRLGPGLGAHTSELKAYISGVVEPLTTSVTFTLACTGPSQTPTPIEETPNPVLPRPATGCASVPGAAWALAVVWLGRRSRRE